MAQLLNPITSPNTHVRIAAIPVYPRINLGIFFGQSSGPSFDYCEPIGACQSMSLSFRGECRDCLLVRAGLRQADSSPCFAKIDKVPTGD